MIPIKDQWAIQLDITSHCIRQCSNCTRCLGHLKTNWHMSVDKFEYALKSTVGFLDQPDDCQGRYRVIGIIGGEPLLHPQFSTITALMVALIPEKRRRGLWTGWKSRPGWVAKKPDWLAWPHGQLCQDAYGYVNWNPHGNPYGASKHTPVLAASKDLIPDASVRHAMQERCWVQRIWSSAINIHGAYFCEVAAALDALYHNGANAMTVEPDWWKRDIPANQRSLCDLCSAFLPLTPRWDREEVDDVSESAEAFLKSICSRRRMHVITTFQADPNWQPERYRT